MIKSDWIVGARLNYERGTPPQLGGRGRALMALASSGARF